MSQRNHSPGFTLIELMVSLVIMTVISAQLLLVFQGQKRAYMTNERILDAQEDARLVMDLLTTEARMGAFMVPRSAGFASIDGGVAGSDVFCVSDATEIADVTLNNASQPFDRARPLGPMVAGGTTLFLQPGHLDIDSDGTDDFTAGQSIIIGDGTNSFCARITVVDPATDRIDIAAPLPNPYGTGARIVPALMYQVGGGVGGLGLLRNGLLLSSEVEDLQIEFGVDVNADNVITVPAEFPINDLTGFDASRILRTRITVTARTSQPDPQFNGAFPAAANRGAGPADNFRRRRFISSSRPRNLGNP